MSSTILESSPVASRVSSAAPSTLAILPFGFNTKTSFTAQQDLTLSRDVNFRVKAPPKDNDIWKLPPPDFRPQRYEPKPPKRNSVEAMRPWRYKTRSEKLQDSKDPDEQEESKSIPHNMKLPHLFHKSVEEEPRFETRFHINDPNEARMEILREGKYNERLLYTLPKPHDFRDLPNIKTLGLLEFETSYEKDPFNNKFNSQRLRTIHGLDLGRSQERDIRGRQMAPPLHQPPKWEQRLIMPKTKWPNLYTAYTRYRLPWRPPEMVLMDRMEETLEHEWHERTAKVKPDSRGQHTQNKDINHGLDEEGSHQQNIDAESEVENT